MHLSFGERSDLVRLQSPVRMMFRHQTVSDVNNPRCVLWDRGSESWSPKFCEIVFSNSSHTGCECSKIGSFGLLEDVVKKDSMARTTFLVMVIVAVAVSTIVIISVVLVAVYCYRIKVRKQLKIKLNNSCFKNQSRCGTMNETPTMTEDLFPADNSDAYDIVRNSDFMVLSRAALAAHDGSQSPHDGLQPLDFCRTLECSVPGPQVRTRPRQLDVATMHGYTGSRDTRVVTGTCHQRLGSPVSRDGAGSHIYMEVDPLYSTFAPSTLYLGSGHQGMSGTGLVSSTSSQTSSGYSTAPSDTQRLSGLVTNLYECEEAEYETSQEPRAYNISQGCGFHHQNQRSSQRQKRPELVMNNILLQQQTNREVL